MKLSQEQKRNILMRHSNALSRGETELYRVYGRYSTEKELSFEAIRQEMHSVDGYALAIIGHNSYSYSCGYYYNVVDEETGELITERFCYHTAHGFCDFVVKSYV